MRLFVAIELSDRVRAALVKAQAALRPTCDGVRWVQTPGLHLTVKFLGEVPDGDVEDTSAAVVEAAAGAAAFDMEVAGCGCFPARGPVRIVWAGVAEPSGALERYVEALEGRLERLGFARERKAFSPHITIGRVREDRSGGRLRSTVEAFELGAMEQPVSSATLMSSVLSPKGATYAQVNRTDFGAVER